jgi:hypothetical protein
VVTRHARLSLAVATVVANLTDPTTAQQVTGERVRYELSRATVVFDNGTLAPDQMGDFAVLVDRGIADIDTLLNGGSSDGRRITYMVRDDGSISRSFRRTIILPADRVRRRAAPYLHETVHVLVPMREDCLWLSEGFASYIQSYVAENIGGYDGYVFSWGGNRNIDRLARRALGTENGRAALPYIGGKGQPPDIFEKRREVAQPLYVLAHSFVKHIVEGVGIGRVKAWSQARGIDERATEFTGRSIEEWKASWLAFLSAPADGAISSSASR